MSGGRSEHVVFDPTSSPFGQVYARLNRDDHAWLQFGLLAGRKPRRLMNVQAGSVAEAVTKVLPVTGLGDQRPRDVVNFLARDARPDRVDRGKLRSEHNSIYLA